VGSQGEKITNLTVKGPSRAVSAVIAGPATRMHIEQRRQSEDELIREDLCDR
jgi:hypothetical protein